MSKVINIVEAEKLLDEELTDKQIDFLLAARQGMALHGVETSEFEKMAELELVQVMAYDNPRAMNAIKGVIPTENGVKVLSIIDNRHWNAPETPIGAQAADPIRKPKALEDAQESGERFATPKPAGKDKAPFGDRKVPVKDSVDPGKTAEEQPETARKQLGKNDPDREALDAKLDGNSKK